MAKKRKASVGVLMLALLAFVSYISREKSGVPETGVNQTAAIDFNQVDINSRRTGTDWMQDKDVSLGRTPERNDAGARETTERRGSGPFLTGQWRVGGLRIVDVRNGKTLPVTEIDLKPTIDRIERGERNAHRNDGSVYRNLNRRLPRQTDGYYREYVVPTPGLGGPGPQRLVLGQKGEVFYTWDHYDNFIRIK